MLYPISASRLYSALVLVTLVQGKPIRTFRELGPGSPELSGTIDGHINRRAGAKMPIIRTGGYPKTNAPPKYATEALEISRCMDDNLWKSGSNLSSDEWFLDTSLRESELNNKDNKEKQHYRQYDSVYDKAILFAHLAKFDTWGLKARFSRKICDLPLSIGFSHPAVPAYMIPKTQSITPVDPTGNPYAKFFQWPQTDDQPPLFSPPWISALIYALDEYEGTRVPAGTNRLEYLRFNLEVIANTTTAVKTIEYDAEMTKLSQEDQNILYNADHSPVFLAGTFAGKEFIKPVSAAVGLEDLSQTAFTYRSINNPVSTAADRPFKFSTWFFPNPTDQDDYKKTLADNGNALKLIYLNGAEKARFDNSPEMLDEAWTIFSNGRFHERTEIFS